MDWKGRRQRVCTGQNDGGDVHLRRARQQLGPQMIGFPLHAVGRVSTVLSAPVSTTIAARSGERSRLAATAAAAWAEANWRPNAIQRRVRPGVVVVQIAPACRKLMKTRCPSQAGVEEASELLLFPFLSKPPWWIRACQSRFPVCRW